MRGWLFDTNILSETRKRKPDANVAAFVAAQVGDLLFTTDVTFAEIRFGIDKLQDAPRRAEILLWLDRTLRPWFAGRVLPITEDVVVRWKTLVAEGRKRGHTFSQPDLFIAAIAALEDLVVVSRDIDQFRKAGVPVFDPWSSTLHVQGKTILLPAPASLEAAAEARRRVEKD